MYTIKIILPYMRALDQANPRRAGLGFALRLLLSAEVEPLRHGTFAGQMSYPGISDGILLWGRRFETRAKASPSNNTADKGTLTN